MGLGTDSALNTVIHGDLHRDLPKFYVTLAEIQEATETRRPNGEISRAWATVWVVTGNMAERSALEMRDGVMTRVTIGKAFNLAGYYSTITLAHRVVADYETYNITAVTHDSLSKSTRLELELVEH